MSKSKVQLRADGGWQSIPDPFPQEDYIGAMEEAGFREFYGDPQGPDAGPLTVHVWLNQQHTPCAYISFSNFDQCPGVYAQTLPDLVEVLGQWLPVVSHAALLDVLARLDAHASYADATQYKPASAMDALLSLIRKAEVGA